MKKMATVAAMGLLCAAVANAVYLLLDIFTKIAFNIQLSRTS